MNTALSSLVLLLVVALASTAYTDNARKYPGGGGSSPDGSATSASSSSANNNAAPSISSPAGQVPSNTHHSQTHHQQHQAPINPSAPATGYGAPQQQLQHTNNPQQVDHQGYYYYYYPVQEQQKTKNKGLFDFDKDSTLVNFLIIGVLAIGGLLVALSYFSVPIESRTLDSLGISYSDVYELASKVYQAINKKY